MTNERHVYITPGISREAFTEVGCRSTFSDPDMTYFVHEHSYDSYGGVPCNQGCTTIRGGQVTHSDLAQS